MDGQVVFGKRQHNHAPHLTHRHHGFLVVKEKQLLDTRRVGLIFFNQLRQCFLGFDKIKQLIFAGIGNNSIGNTTHLVPIMLNDAIANSGCAGINA